jgi:glycosyltransferase involved in cell wall biosynthesis
MPRGKVAFFGPQYGMGGAGRVCADVGKALARKGYDVDFLVDGSYSEGGYLEEGLPGNCRIIKLTDTDYSKFSYNPISVFGIIINLVDYLSSSEVDILISNLTKFNIISIWASLVPGLVRGVIIVEQNLLRTSLTNRSQIISNIVSTQYLFSDKIIAVSADVKKDLCKNHGIKDGLCVTIRNPLDVENVINKSIENVEHEWFLDSVPIILGVGRFVEQKQFSVLIESFELLTRREDVRLVLAGDGPLRKKLHSLAVELGIEERVDFLGFVSNPYKYMRRAQLLAISSQYEGFGVVVVEALACGTPIVSTNCPGGPSDILNDGEYGELVDVGDPNELAEAMARTLKNPPDRDRLIDRARFYDVDKVADRYATLIDGAMK